MSARLTHITSLACALASLTSSAALGGSIESLRFIDRAVLPYSAGFNGTIFNGTLFGGISGIDFDASTGEYVALSDDRSQNAPPGGVNSARYYRLSLAVTPEGFDDIAPITINSVTTLLRPDGSAFPTLNVDPESIRVLPGAGAPTLLWTSEGAAANSSAPPLQNPFLREMNADGSFVREFAVPDMFFPDGVGGAQTKGIRNNLAFECLTLSADGERVYVAAESALFQDGPIATFAGGTFARIAEFDRATGSQLRQFAYPVDAIPVNPQGAFADNGLPELLALEDGSFLAVERSFITGYGNHIRIYRISLDAATDVSTLPSLAGATFAPVTKSLLTTITPAIGFAPDNIEGICLGPTLPNGVRTFILVSDNNFAATQITQFLLFAESASPDLNGDGSVDAGDLGILLGNWATDGVGDIDLSGGVDAADLGILLAAWS